MNREETCRYLELGSRAFGDQAGENGPSREGVLKKRIRSANIPSKPEPAKLGKVEWVWSKKYKDVFKVVRKSKKGNIIVVDEFNQKTKEIVLPLKDVSAFHWPEGSRYAESKA